ncbi:MAG TPA: stage VI sporulation protein D [Bacillales bacterium]|nr:stage VI sporulation protein D [Bacillales bacterium]
MAEEESKTLRFSIEESVWLNKGREVDEVLSMSLEPDISIVENKHYVSVRGALKLSGRYRPLESDDGGSNEPSLNDDRPLKDQVPVRPIDQLTLSEDGTVRIEHRFPVDITIPLSRIDRLEDIYVTVDAFDYTLPENDCLRLEADISISGMTEEMSQNEKQDDMRETDKDTEIETVSTAVEENPEEGENREPEEVPVAAETFSATRGAEERDAAMYEPFHYEAVRQAAEEESHEPVTEEVGTRSGGPHVEMKTRAGETAEPGGFFNLPHEYGETEPDPASAEDGGRETVNEDAEEETEREENALYLTKMLSKEEEEFSRLKMCIIQPGESLDTIAERYQLPLSQLIRVNDLESEDVEEGQVLYVPVSS